MESPEYLAQDRGPVMFRLTIAMLVLPTVSVALRFWSRLTRSTSIVLWWDDWLALAAWMCIVGICSISFAAINIGLGKHIQTIDSPRTVEHILKYFYASSILLNIALSLTKFSALCFYLRVFTVHSTTFKICIGLTFFAVTAFTCFKVPQQIASCVPIHKFWQPEVPGVCNNDSTNFGILLSGLLLDALTDIAILLLPMPIISGLHMRKGRRAIIMLTFACGYAAAVMSILRLAAFLKLRDDLTNPDFSYVQIDPLAWSLADIGISVFSIGIPIWAHLLRRGVDVLSTFALDTRDRLFPRFANHARRIPSIGGGADRVELGARGDGSGEPSGASDGKNASTWMGGVSVHTDIRVELETRSEMDDIQALDMPWPATSYSRARARAGKAR